MYSGSVGQDWEVVKFSKFIPKEKKTELVAKTKLNTTNSTSSIEAYQQLSKIEKEDENLHIERISSELKQQIIRARCDKKLTQADLAKKINEPLKLVQEYENGKAIPNNQILQKMSRVLGVTLKKKPTSSIKSLPSKNG